MELQEKRSLIDLSLAELLKPNWEKVFYFVVFLLAVASRFWALGARAMSHDESLHALYSYYLYNGSGYVHNPMMHGPFLFHVNAVIYFLFGDDDFTARIVPALFGIFMVLSPLLLRRWLGRVGAAVTALLLLISPSFLYYSRYIRNDIYITVWTILLIAALFHFLRSHKPGWLYLGAAVLMLSLATKENSYIFGYIGLIFILQVFLWERGVGGGRHLRLRIGGIELTETLLGRRHMWLYIGGGVLTVALLVVAGLLGRTPAEAVDAAEGTGSIMKLVIAVVTVVGATIPAALVSGTLLRSRYPQPSSVQEALRSLTWRNWIVAGLVSFMIYALLFSTFFTNPVGLGTGIFGSISYWLAQQEVQRGGQPWYYYLLLLPMYEFVPLIFSLVATVYYLIRGQAKRPKPSPTDHDDGMPVEEQGSRDLDAVFVSFLIFWAVSSLFIYSWAGEKMPWLVVHPALPMIVLSGKLAGDLFERVDWKEIWRRGGALFAVLLPITLFGLFMLVKLQPFQGLSVFKLQETGNWLTALLVSLLLVVLTVMVIRRLGGGHSLIVAVATTLVFLSFFTVRFAWMAAFINYDYATELLVYAHGAADVKPTMAEIAEISARTVGDKMIEVAYDSDVSWPLEWYMREYPNRQFYGETPTRDKLDVPVILAGDKNNEKVEPFLADRYYRFERRLVWWPNQEYMGLTWERIRDLLASPEKRSTLWKALYYREYPRKPDDWYHVHTFYLYVRKDVAHQLWDFGAVPPDVFELPPDPYVEAYVDLGSELVWGSLGTEPGMMNHPRGVAVGPDGNIYVVDSDNNRIQVFSRDGVYLYEWGSQCNLTTGVGCADLDGDGPMGYGDGQFQEPWGIAVAGDGRVYVADTWNHRIQVFGSDGTYLAKWGTYGQTASDTSLLYGPRDVSVDPAGRVLVTDTGNKRVMVFDQDGNFLERFGSEGILTGQFSEPVGIDYSSGGLYVADTWNRRVQVFDENLFSLHEWTVEAWYGQSVVNKPYIAVDEAGRVYITDPEGYRVAVFDSEGNLTATFGRYGFDEGSFSLPTGIDVDEEGYIYVADTDGHRVIKFAPLP